MYGLQFNDVSIVTLLSRVLTSARLTLFYSIWWICVCNHVCDGAGRLVVGGMTSC